ncbi:hypothetical protein BJ912DRAFT_1146929 [Pholiota molesta]|nr:hypothetical protein BJ912DRAFT_1146929 [Pholiota molesta]
MSAEVATQNQNRACRGWHHPQANDAKRSTDTGAPAAEPAPAATRQPSATAAAPLSDAGEEVCWICAEPVKYYSVSECNHRTCHVCALRLRALYKKTQCTFCKVPQTHVIFTTSTDALYESYTPEAIPFKDAKLAISFETEEMMEETLILLRFNCPDPECDYIANGWSDLRLHVRGMHGKLMCDLCIRHKKVFSHEHSLYSPAMLAAHLPSTTQAQRSGKSAVKETPAGGVHPLCAFCHECFFSDDELYAHMRENHEECFICKRNEVRDQYFQNYESLERHFNTVHQPCTHPECLAQKFVVFNTPLDLKAHIVEVHGGDMSSRDKRDARRIQADFVFEEVGYGGRHGRGGRDRDRDRDRDRERTREPPPHQPAPPPQQQQAQQPSTAAAASRPTPPPGGRRREGFGGALTTDSGPAAASSNAGRGTRPPSPQPATDIDPETAQRHAAFLARLQSIAPNPTAAVPAVKAATRSYRHSESSARDLIQIIWNVMDTNLESTASIVNAFVDLVDEEEKKQDLLASWKGFAIEQRRQFPDLVPTAIGSGYAGITSGRVLNAKHSTATRSSQNQQVWNRVEMAASSSSAPALPPPRPAVERFPVLGRASPAPAHHPPPAVAQSFRGTGGPRSTPWSGSSAPPPALRTQPQPVVAAPVVRKAAAGGKQAPPPKLSSALFPELPSSAGARSKLQVSGNVSLRNILGTGGAPAVAAWSAGPSGGGTSSSQAAAAEPEAEADVSAAPAATGNGKGKKSKGKQKQTLFTLGSFPT